MNKQTLKEKNVTKRTLIKLYSDYIMYIMSTKRFAAINTFLAPVS